MVDDENALHAATGNTDSTEESDSVSDELVDINNAFVAFRHSHQEPPVSSLVYDVLYRPLALENICMWDLLGQYEKISLTPGAERVPSIPIAMMNVPIRLYPDQHYRLLVDIPNKVPWTTKAQRTPRTRSPWLSHPRKDLSKDDDRYAIAMLALFMPWRRSKTAPLNPNDVLSKNGIQALLKGLDPSLIDRRPADFSAMSRQRYASFAAGGGHPTTHIDGEEDDLSHDLNWQLGQMESEPQPSPDAENPEISSTSDFQERCGHRALQTVNAVRVLTMAANIYTPNLVDHHYVGKIGGSVHATSGEASYEILDAVERMAGHRAAVRQLRHARQESNANGDAESHRQRNYSHWYNAPMRTTLSQEAELAKAQSVRAHKGDDRYWAQLDGWKKLAISVSEAYTLNREQRLAFLLIANSRLQLLGNPGRAPYRLVVAGPGGTGKSRMYDAELTFTAPTGIAAANIGGSTVAAELSLRVALKSLLAKNSRSLATLSERLQYTKMLIIDEFLFMGTSQFEKASRYINLARHCTDDAFGHLDVVLSGDQFQLLCPNTTSLYNHRYTSLADISASVQSLSAHARSNAIAVKNYWEIQNCVVFDQVIRQQCPRYVDLLTRLRKGLCTIRGKDSDLAYLQQFELNRHHYTSTDDPVNIDQWVEASLLPPR
ncbi:hypothetical protein BDZ89DRAFT_1142466 [Hymenopellis radicata]|nr:hypothetical protein BDZ89DRAFT_1142466 [Hymenopellis radicata]